MGTRRLGLLTCPNGLQGRAKHANSSKSRTNHARHAGKAVYFMPLFAIQTRNDVRTVLRGTGNQGKQQETAVN